MRAAAVYNHNICAIYTALHVYLAVYDDNTCIFFIQPQILTSKSSQNHVPFSEPYINLISIYPVVLLVGMGLLHKSGGESEFVSCFF